MMWASAADAQPVASSLAELKGLGNAESKVTVTDTTGKRVDQGDGQVDAQNRRHLRVSLPALAPGVYRVMWRVLAVDGHRTDGDFKFTLRSPE